MFLHAMNAPARGDIHGLVEKGIQRLLRTRGHAQATDKGADKAVEADTVVRDHLKLAEASVGGG